MEGKIIQMIPADGLVAVYVNDGIEEKSKVDLIVLDDEGNIHPYDMDQAGCFDIPDQASNFVKYINK